MELIQIDLRWLTTTGLNINEYLTLLKIYQKQDIPFNVSKDEINSLIESGYLVEKEEGVYNYTFKTFTIFQEQPEEDLFEEFYRLFPHKVPDGQQGYRHTSTQDPRGMAAKRTRQIWSRLVGKKIAKQDHIIKCLRAELKYRTNKGSLMYLNNIDTWLRQAKWEEWEYLIATENSDNQSSTTSSGMTKL